jgi:hypothetical protein
MGNKGDEEWSVSYLEMRKIALIFGLGGFGPALGT